MVKSNVLTTCLLPMVTEMAQAQELTSSQDNPLIDAQDPQEAASSLSVYELEEVRKLVAEGWRPCIKEIRNTNYYIMRLGNKKTKSYGPFTKNKWVEVLALLPQEEQVKFPVPNIVDAIPSKEAQATAKKPEFQTFPREQDVRTFIARANLSFDPTVIAWYACYKENGYPDNFNTWINEIIHHYFQMQNKHIGIVSEGIYQKTAEAIGNGE